MQKQPVLPPCPRADLTGRVVIVTGANTGLGLAAAKHFATMNPAKLILTSRNADKGAKALEELRKETSFDRAEVGLLDLSSFASVKSFVEKFTKENDRLDLLVANAASIREDYVSTEDGWEEGMQVNVISPALHIFLLLPLMLKTAEEHPEHTPRITVVGSAYHQFTVLDKDVISSSKPLALMSSKEYSTSFFDGGGIPDMSKTVNATMLDRRYGDVKLFNLYFVRELHRLLTSANKRITTNVLSPGFCVSELRRNITGERRNIMEQAVEAVAYTSEEGGRCLVHAAIGDQDKESSMSGVYLNYMKHSETSPFSNSPDGLQVQRNLWAELLEVLQGVDKRVSGILNELNN